jgi:hypothetical protein
LHPCAFPASIQVARGLFPVMRGYVQMQSEFTPKFREKGIAWLSKAFPDRQFDAW